MIRGFGLSVVLSIFRGFSSSCGVGVGLRVASRPSGDSGRPATAQTPAWLRPASNFCVPTHPQRPHTLRHLSAGRVIRTLPGRRVNPRLGAGSERRTRRQRHRQRTRRSAHSRRRPNPTDRRSSAVRWCSRLRPATGMPTLTKSTERHLALRHAAALPVRPIAGCLVRFHAGTVSGRCTQPGDARTDHV